MKQVINGTNLEKLRQVYETLVDAVLIVAAIALPFYIIAAV
ncbi:MAG: hypothetical protein WBN40_01545 [Pseudomonadales bacterium]